MSKSFQGWKGRLLGLCGVSSLVLAGCGQAAPPDETESVAVSEAPLTAGTKINCGASAVGLYAADGNFSGGSTFTSTNTIDTSLVLSPAPAAVYQSARFGTFTYTLPGFAAGSSQRVRLHFAETVQSAVGARRFNVSINGTNVLSNFDIFQAAGAKNKAVVREFVRTANASGQYVVSFTSVTGQAMVSGIEVVTRTRYLANDYDGDGKADFAYFSPADNAFHVRKRAGGADLVQTGALATDVFVPGDYDGDGRTDYGYFRPAEGKWYAVLQSGAAFTPIAYGSATDRMVPGDYDADGKTDAAYFRPSEGKWYVRLSSGGFASTTFGAATDILEPGDYDGDNKTDYAFFRPSEGRWYVRPSRGGANVLTYFGASTDRPVPADFDGDSRTDLAIFRPGEGTWYIHPSNGGADIVIPYGAANDRLEPADYDGDGKAEPGLFRHWNNTWFVAASTGGEITTSFGKGTDVQITNGPVGRRRFYAQVTADYDGDQRSDVVFFRSEDGTWQVIQSSGGTQNAQFGQAGDRPFPGDFDGDGKADLALYRPNGGGWNAVLSATNTAYYAQFGAATDIIAPGDYDGDGKTDPGLFRPDPGNWYAHLSGGGADLYLPSFGNSLAIPVPGDYDGDGKTDFAYLGTDALRHIHPSGGGADYTIAFGGQGDRLVHGDFDGDGRGDHALFRVGEGWYVAYSAGGSTGPVAFGEAGDRQVPRDYDGDGRADFSLYRPGTNAWWIWPSAGGAQYTVSGGAATDIAVGGVDYGWTTAVCPGPICATTDPQCGTPGHPNCCSVAQCQAACAQTTQVCNSLPWPNGILYFEVMDSTLTARFNTAADAWTTMTGGRITFQQSSTRGDRVQIFKDAVNPDGGGGSCNVGWSGGLRGCTWGGGMPATTGMHELGHALGLMHEQLRADRDRYIEMIPNAMDCTQFSDNIWKCGADDTGSGYGVYDMNSVMHYGSGHPYYIMDRATYVPFVSPPSWSVTPHDASNVLELYASQYAASGRSWHKFVSLGLDVGANKPLSPKVPAPPAAAPGTLISGRPAIASQGGVGALDSFVRGADGVIYHRYRNTTGNWSGYFSMGGTFDTDPAATSWGTGTSIIVAGSQGKIYWKKYQNSAWGSWTQLPNLPSALASGSSPAVASWASGVLHVLVRLQNNTLSIIAYTNGAWGTWAAVPPATPSGVTFAGSPVLTSQGANSLNIFTNTANGHLYHTFFSSGWWNVWEDNACCLATNSSPAAASWGTGRVDVLYKGSDGNLWWRYFENGWHGNYPLGGMLSSSPAAVAPYANHMDILATEADSGVWHRWYQ